MIDLVHPEREEVEHWGEMNWMDGWHLYDYSCLPD